MTQFAETLRHYCRNRHCRTRLKAPVENAHDAFCTRGCYDSFHRKRCVVCERPMERRTERQLVCGKRRCRNALQARQNLGRYLAPSNGVSPLENPIKPGIKIDGAVDRPWRLVAGPALTPNQFHCATIGGAEAVEAANRTNLRYWREANAKAEAKTLVKRHDLPGTITLGQPRQDACRVYVIGKTHRLPDDLSIPDFLRR